jgi:hypothetical protein
MQDDVPRQLPSFLAIERERYPLVMRVQAKPRRLYGRRAGVKSNVLRGGGGQIGDEDHIITDLLCRLFPAGRPDTAPHTGVTYPKGHPYRKRLIVY